MFACIFVPGIEAAQYPRLIEFASLFSPLVEETTSDAVIVDLRGCESLVGPVPGFCERISALALKYGFSIHSAVAENPDAAYHAARGAEQHLFIESGQEGEILGHLPIEIINPDIAGVSEERFQEILMTLRSWGIYRFGQLAALSLSGISERLGPEGVRIRQLASGRTCRSIVVRNPEWVFSRSLAMEHPISEKESLLFIFSRLLKEICEELESRNLAASSLLIQLRLGDRSFLDRKIDFPAPIREVKTLHKILDLEISASPPRAPVTNVSITILPGKRRRIQSGLFAPGGPEPDKAELVLARIEKMVGRGNAGSPEVKDSHSPDPFQMRHFDPTPGRLNGKKGLKDLKRNSHAMRMLRPPLRTSVWFEHNRPIRLHAPDAGIRKGISGKIAKASGPWRSSGEWWSDQGWSREEWDFQLTDGPVCRAYHDRLTDAWYVDGLYD